LAQLLVQVVPVNNLAAGATQTAPHLLESNGVAVAPTLVFPDRDTSISVVSVSTVGVTFINNGTATASANFRCERGWQPEVDAFTVTPLLYKGGGGSSAAGVMNKVFALTSPIVDFADNTNTEQKFTQGQVTLPANTLGSASTIRFRLAANLSQAGAGTIRVRFYGQDGLGTLLADTGALNFANANAFVLDTTATVRSAGATAATVGSVNGFVVASGFATQTPNGANLDTTVATALTMTVTFSAAAVGTNIDINEFEVYVAR
jgi:hypothetical protein